MRKAIVAGFVALAATFVVPMTASAATTAQRKAPVVTYYLTGTLSGYTAATSSSPGSITILVKHSNYQAKSLKGQTLTFSTSTKTKVTLHNHKAIADGDNGVVSVRSTKKADAATLEAATPRQIIDKGAPKTKK